MDLSVAIRTAIVSKGEAHFAVGGGVVYDSKEEDEYDETLHKGRTLFKLIEREDKWGEGQGPEVPALPPRPPSQPA